MTPSGRPPRSSSTATKTITVRVTEAEHAILTRAADPQYVSHWMRKLALDSGDVQELLGPPSADADVDDALSQMSIGIEKAAEKLDETKRAEAVAVAESIRTLKRKLLAMIARHQRELSESAARERRVHESADALRAELYRLTGNKALAPSEDPTDV